MNLTANRLREVLDYDPGTGVFTWRVRVNAHGGPRNVGDAAGRVNGDGYRVIGVDRVIYRANRLAVFYMTGAWPVGEVDHIDTNRANDAWINLRDVGRRTNSENTRRARTTNLSSGLLGVSRRNSGDPTRPWCAHITVAGKQKHLGIFAAAEDAHAAYIAAKRQLHEGNTL